MMKNQCKKICSLILIMTMLLSVFSVTAGAVEESPMTISVSSSSGAVGQEVEVFINVKNNPGINSMSLSVSFESELTLKSVEYNKSFDGTAMKPEKLSSPVTLAWANPLENCNENGTFAKLRFMINKNVQGNSETSIKLDFDPENIYNVEEKNIPTVVENGTVKIYPNIPGDVNADGKQNNKDFTRLFQWLSGWNVVINQAVADVNNDGKISNKDATRLFQWLSDWDVEIFLDGQGYKKCQHSLEEIAAKAATCNQKGNIAYWHCTKCGKYFSDKNGIAGITLNDTVIEAKGHSLEAHAAKQPTTTSEGNIAYWYCTECKKYFSDSKGTKEIAKKDTVIPPLKKNEYEIDYDINNDYLENVGVNNPNPLTYYKEDGLVLKDLKADGFKFLGWYTAAEGGTLVTEIPQGTAGAKAIYAQWKEVEYKITFDSPDVPVDSQKYKISTGATLQKPSLGGYTFVGWSKDGKIVTTIPKGTTGNITLHANWTSNRNRAEAVSKLEEPSIIEDYDNGSIIFIYEIGKINNVPLSRIDVGENEIPGPSDGLDLNKTYRYSTTVNSKFVETAANTISNATTRSSEWVLSEDWNETTSAINEYEEEIGKVHTRSDEKGVEVGDKYYVSNSQGGSTASASSIGGSSSSSSKVTTNDSKGISGSYTYDKEMGVSVGLGVGGKFSLGAEVNPEVSVLWGLADVSLGKISAGLELSANANIESYRKDREIFNISTNRNSSVGTENINENEKHWDMSESLESNWNTEQGYEKSSKVNETNYLSDTISNVINKRWEYSSTDSIGGSKSNALSDSESQEAKKEYISTVEYSTEDKTEIETSQTIRRSESGYYRLVNAGTVHVFAVVGYDIATNSYFTYTYDVLDKERHIFVDFSKENALFNDCENAILPFEIPIEVNDYVSRVMGGTNGFSINENGIISEKYTGNAEYVVIPQYVSIKNTNNTYSAVRVREITSNVFQGNKNIKGVILPKYVSEIPDNAFEGCTSLEVVEGYGITTIGENAFKDCTSLNKFVIDKYVTSVGRNAFKNVAEIEVKAGNTDVAESILKSGAKKISLDISEMQNTRTNAFENKTLVMDDSADFFHIMSNNKTYKNISIQSNAKETHISNMIFQNNTKTPMDIDSSAITLGSIKVENCSGIAMILRAANTDLKLFGTIDLNSNENITAVSRNVTLLKDNPSVTSVLKVNGAYLVCSQMKNQELFRGSLTVIDESEYKKWINGFTVKFDANGGTFSESVGTKFVYYGQTYGELPSKINKDYHNFDGWYTQSSGGTKITSSSTFTGNSNITLYAHWTQKQPSGWVLASNVPSGAMIKDTKWTYDLTTTTTSSNSSLAGYTLYNTTWRWSDYGAWSGWQRDAISGSDSRQVNTRYIEPTYKTQYNYNRWINNSKSNWGPCAGTWSGVYCGNYEERGWSDEPLPCTSDPIWSGQLGGYFRMYGYNKDLWYNETTRQVQTGGGYTEYQYRDRYQIYTYYFKKVESKESSTEVRTSDSISNVNKWVRYIEK